MPLFRDKSADKLYAHLLNLGVQVELLNDHPLQQVGPPDRKKKSLGLIQVSGKSIDYINIISLRPESGDARREYYLEYLVLLEDIPPKSCWAVLETEKRGGLLRRKVADIEWTGDILADKLNGDLTLKDNLLKEFQLNRPWDISVVDEPDYRCARIETEECRLVRMNPGPMPLPSGNLFDCIDRIAELTAEHVTKANS